MADDKRQAALQDLVLVQLLYLNARVQGVVVGLLAGLAIFVATNWLVLKGGDVVGPHLALLGQFFIGYRVSFVGSLIGFAYGFAAGYVVGYSAARLYNGIARLRDAAGARARSGKAEAAARQVPTTRGRPPRQG
jgi:hypothetical protein